MVPIKNNPDFQEERPSINIAVTAIFAFLFFIFVKPMFDDTFHFFGFRLFTINVYPVLLLVITFIVFCLAIKTADKSKRIDVFIAAFALMCVFVAIASILYPGTGETSHLNGEDFIIGPAIISWAIDWFPLLGVVCVIYAFHEEYTWELIWGFLFASGIYLLLNLVFIFMQDLSSTRINALPFGFRNVTFRIAIPAFVCSLAISIKYKRWYSFLPIIVYVTALLQILLAYSATSLCAFAVMGVVAVLTHWKKARKYLNALTYSASYLVLAFSVVILRIQNLMGPLISALLHKDVTFTGRTLLWDQAMQKLSGWHFFTGYGNDYYWHTFAIDQTMHKHAHNEVLNMLMLGGVFAFASFVVMFFESVKVLFKNRFWDIANAFSIGLAGFLVIGIAEIGLSPGLMYILAGSYYLVPKIIKDSEEYAESMKLPVY